MKPRNGKIKRYLTYHSYAGLNAWHTWDAFELAVCANAAGLRGLWDIKPSIS